MRKSAFNSPRCICLHKKPLSSLACQFYVFPSCVCMCFVLSANLIRLTGDENEIYQKVRLANMHVKYDLRQTRHTGRSPHVNWATKMHAQFSRTLTAKCTGQVFLVLNGRPQSSSVNSREHVNHAPDCGRSSPCTCCKHMSAWHWRGALLPCSRHYFNCWRCVWKHETARISRTCPAGCPWKSRPKVAANKVCHNAHVLLSTIRNMQRSAAHTQHSLHGWPACCVVQLHLSGLFFGKSVFPTPLYGFCFILLWKGFRNVNQKCWRACTISFSSALFWKTMFDNVEHEQCRTFLLLV